MGGATDNYVSDGVLLTVLTAKQEHDGDYVSESDANRAADSVLFAPDAEVADLVVDEGKLTGTDQFFPETNTDTTDPLQDSRDTSDAEANAAADEVLFDEAEDSDPDISEKEVDALADEVLFDGDDTTDDDDTDDDSTDDGDTTDDDTTDDDDDTTDDDTDDDDDTTDDDTTDDDATSTSRPDPDGTPEERAAAEAWAQKNGFTGHQVGLGDETITAGDHDTIDRTGSGATNNDALTGGEDERIHQGGGGRERPGSHNIDPTDEDDIGVGEGEYIEPDLGGHLNVQGTENLGTGPSNEDVLDRLTDDSGSRSDSVRTSPPSHVEATLEASVESESVVVAQASVAPQAVAPDGPESDGPEQLAEPIDAVASILDSDGDGIIDEVEIANGTDPFSAFPAFDDPAPEPSPAQDPQVSKGADLPQEALGERVEAPLGKLLPSGADDAGSLRPLVDAGLLTETEAITDNVGPTPADTTATENSIDHDPKLVGHTNDTDPADFGFVDIVEENSTFDVGLVADITDAPVLLEDDDPFTEDVE